MSSTPRTPPAIVLTNCNSVGEQAPNGKCKNVDKIKKTPHTATDIDITDSVCGSVDNKTSIANGSANTRCSKCDSIMKQTADREIRCENCSESDSSKVADFFRNSNGGLYAEGSSHEVAPPDAHSPREATQSEQESQSQSQSQSRSGDGIKCEEPITRVKCVATRAATRATPPVAIPKAQSHPFLSSASSPKRQLPTDRWKAFKVLLTILYLVTLLFLGI